MKIEARPWTPQDLLDDLQGIIDEESDNYLNTRRTTLETALAYLKEYFDEDIFVGKWIPVTERLPEDGEQVLACTKNGKAFSAHYDHFWGKWSVSHTVKITHWMPLPPAPKEVK